MTIRKPRVRNAKAEVALPTWEHFANADPLTPRAVEQMVLGVSTRNYARSIEPGPRGMKSRGTSKSAVSRRFVAATEETLTTMMSRDLSSISLCAIVIDGIHIGEHLIVVALGIDESGDKHVLGLHEGATENESVCAALLGDLVARGVRSRAMLFVIDGGKALALAIRKTFGKHSLIQRCQVHKRWNVEGHLTTHNVTQWSSGSMALRWVAVARVEASKTFRKLRGYKGMPILIAALRAHDSTLNPKSIDDRKNAA